MNLDCIKLQIVYPANRYHTESRDILIVSILFSGRGEEMVYRYSPLGVNQISNTFRIHEGIFIYQAFHVVDLVVHNNTHHRTLNWLGYYQDASTTSF